MEATALATTPAPRPPAAPRTHRIEIVVPVKDEEVVLAASVRRLCDYLETSYPFAADVCIVDNGSTDGTWQVALGLAEELDGVRAVHLDRPGRGHALRTVWSCSEADVLAYLDVDLSTDLDALLPLTAPLLSGHSDVAIGTRLAPGSNVVRGPYREVLSRGYNLLLRTVLGVRFTDAQCGFKALRADVAARLLPLVQDGSWFFDTELLVLAERAGLRIHEVPVDWVDDLDSRVDVPRTVVDDLRGVARLAAPLAVRVVRFAVVGVLSAVAYALLYLLLREAVAPQAANVVALLLTAIANTATNRRFTFGVSGRRDRVVHHLKGLVTFGVGWAITATALVLLGSGASTGAEIAVLTVANLLATAVRFLLLSAWVFTGRSAS